MVLHPDSIIRWNGFETRLFILLGAGWEVERKPHYSKHEWALAKWKRAHVDDYIYFVHRANSMLGRLTIGKHDGGAQGTYTLDFMIQKSFRNFARQRHLSDAVVMGDLEISELYDLILQKQKQYPSAGNAPIPTADIIKLSA